MELASCHPSDASNVEVAPSFFRKFVYPCAIQMPIDTKFTAQQN